MTVKKMAMIAIFTGVASIINILESYVQLVPGTAFKIGFSNIVTLIILYVYGAKEAATVVILRLIVTALFAPGTFNGVTFTLSLSGAIFSLITLIILKKLDFFGILAVSAISSVMHVLGQILAATYVITEAALFYAPLMLFLSVPAGILTGILANRFLDSTKELFIEKKF